MSDAPDAGTSPAASSPPGRGALRAGALVALAAAALLLPGRWGQAALLPFLALFPGLAVARLAFPDQPRLTRVAFALALAPLVATLAGWGVLALGACMATAARVVAVAGAVGWLVAARSAPPLAPPRAGTDRALVLLASALAVAVVVPPFVNAYIAVRGDSFTHAAIALRILEHGVPPEDPYFAGMRLNYVWFYNLFIALLCALRGQEPFAFMTLFNGATAFAMVILAGVTATKLWGRREAGWGAALLLTLGFNAGAWLLWPFGLLRALSGEVRGAAEVARIVKTLEPGTARIVYGLHAPFAHMVSFLDKLLVGTAINYAYLLMMLLLWGLLAGLRAGARGPAIAAAAAAGLMLFHGVVGLSFIPVVLGALGILLVAARLLPWLPRGGRVFAMGCAIAAGAAVTAPYVMLISSGIRSGAGAGGVRFPTFQPIMLWTIATSCAFPLLLALRPLAEAWRGRDAAPVVLGLVALAMTGFAAVVGLPEHNEAKFAFQVFYPLVLLSAAAVPGFLAAVRARGPLVAALFGAVVLVTPALTLQGFACDPGARTEPHANLAPGERELYDWLRRETPRDAVIVDRDPWSHAVVFAHRQLLLGGESAPQFSFPPDQLAERSAMLRAVEAGQPPALDALRRLARPSFVVYRPSRPQPADSLPGLERVYDAAGYRVYRVAARP